jgi:hypothetical protein
MTFHVGQKVVCVNVSANSVGYSPPELVRGRIYIVAGIDEASDFERDIGLYLVGINPTPIEGLSDSFKSWRFRPIVERKTDISALKALLVPGTKIRETA